VAEPSVSLRSSIVYLDDMNDFDAIIIHRWFKESIPERLTCRPIAEFSEVEVISRFRDRKDSENLRDFAVRRTDDGALLGRVTYFDLNPRNRTAEIGFLVAPEYRRKGYSYEALRLLLKYLFEEMGLNKVTAQTGEFNQASIALLKKLGFKRDGTLRQHHELEGKMYDDLLFSILAQEFSGD
jgi:ribosomal-protein-alanine N-acetyltransferase